MAAGNWAHDMPIAVNMSGVLPWKMDDAYWSVPPPRRPLQLLEKIVKQWKAKPVKGGIPFWL